MKKTTCANDVSDVSNIAASAIAKTPRRSCVGGFALTLLEIFAIFGVFVAYGAWPVPDVNEQYYVGKAIHFWNHAWLGNDPFLNTPDSHWLFYAVFGLLSLAFKQNTLVWVGRSVVWFATACAWLRLSRALIPRRWAAVLTAAAFAFYLESFHLAGEWIIGGVEGKALAFPFVFWGLACFVERKYNAAWILLGIASAFHVLVGGWVVLALLIVLGAQAFYSAVFRSAKTSADGSIADADSSKTAKVVLLFKRCYGLFLGGAISLLGLVPALALDRGATVAEIVASRRIYVYERLSHHLVVSSLPWTFLLRFAALIFVFLTVWALWKSMTRINDAYLANTAKDSTNSSDCATDAPADVCAEFRAVEAEYKSRAELRSRYVRLRAFTIVALAIACFGACVDFGSRWLEANGTIDTHEAAAGILRYYWYRLSDWALPCGLVFFLGAAVEETFYYRRLRRAGGKSSAETSLADPAIYAWIALSFGVYWALRTWLNRVAAAVAASKAVDGLVPLPKPTEAPAFMSTAALVGLVLTLAFFVVSLSKRVKSSRTLMNGLVFWLAMLAVAAPAWRFASFVDLRGTKVIPRSAPPKESIADGWLDACHWCRDHIAGTAVFLVPRGCDSFKWEAQRAEAGSWKEIPQDASSIVDWNKKMKAFYANPGAEPDSANYWNQPLVGVFINKGRAKVREEAQKYGYQFALVETPPYVVATIPEALKRWNEFVENKDIVYQNDQYIVLKLTDDDGYLGHKDAKSESAER